MSKITDTFAYSVGKKTIMALSGLFLITFLPVHLAGNFLLFAGEGAFMEYAEFMGSMTNIPIRVAEVILFLGFIIHIVEAYVLTNQNNKAKGQRYAVNAGGKTSTWFSRNMHWTGTVILVFLVLHLLSFFVEARFGWDVDVAMTGGEPNLYHKVVASFSVWWYVVINVLAMAFLAFHLNHGFQSAFQTMGWRHKKYFPIFKAVGTGYAWLIPLAYAIIPIYFFITSLQ